MRDTIIFLGTFIMPDKNAAAIRVIGIARILKVLGYSIIFAGDNVGDKNYVQIENGIGYYCREKWHRIGYYYNANYAIKRIEQIGAQNVHSVILYHTPALVALKVKRFCDHNGINIIADTTEWYSIRRQLWPGNVVIKTLNMWARLFISNKLIHNNIVISAYLEKFYKKLKCNVIRIPILTTDLYPRIDEKEDIVRFCYCGSPTRKDQLLPIVKAFQRALDAKLNVELTIAGCTKEQFESINKYRIPDNITDRVSFLGRVSHQEAIKVVSSARFSFIIRPDERYARAGFPTKMIEAFSCGTGVIASPIGDISLYVKNGLNGFLVSGNVEDSIFTIIQKICKMSNKELRLISQEAYESAKGFEPRVFTDGMKGFLNTCNNSNKRD